MVPLPFPPLDSWTYEAWLSEKSTSDLEYVWPCGKPCSTQPGKVPFSREFSKGRSTVLLCQPLWDGGKTVGKFPEHGLWLYLLCREVGFLIAGDAVWRATASK